MLFKVTIGTERLLTALSKAIVILFHPMGLTLRLLLLRLYLSDLVFDRSAPPKILLLVLRLARWAL